MPFATRMSAPQAAKARSSNWFPVGRVDDPLERDADRLASRVLQTPANGRREGRAWPSSAPAGPAGGAPLDGEAREFFEPRFRHDFELRALASELDAATLDELEREEGYLVWTLRLAPLVEHDRARARAQRYLDNPNWHVRHWAHVAIRS